jgi:cyanophycin synthetase
MPTEAPAADPEHPAAGGVELLELRVLEGPNRFFARPAVKLEFHSEQPGSAAATARAAGDAVRSLFLALGDPAPPVAQRESVDTRRAIVAFPWRRRVIAQATAAAAARVALGLRPEAAELAQLRTVAPGPLASLPQARIPIVAITGTNGKSTVTRLVAHIAARARRRVGMTNSDGIFVDGELVEAGDWTGFGGAGRVLAEPGLELAVLETARGGILLRGIGYRTNRVGVVTNVQADHLGLQGIDTLDELAEVKATVVRITRSDGWAVLNGEDPRVWEMRHETKARWYVFSTDPAAPAVADALGHGGRAAVGEDGWLVLRRAGRRRLRLVRADEAPVTFAGLSRANVANALAAAAVADGLGIAPRQIRAGLRTFAAEPTANPGRLNLFERDGQLVLIDFAHNEAGLWGLVEVGRRLAGRGRLLLALGTAGDRTDEMLRGMGAVAAAADELVICHKEHYLRGRSAAEMEVLFRAGAAAAGRSGEVPAYPTEIEALRALVSRSRPGDVVTVMTHAERPEVFAWLAAEGFRAVDAERLRGLVAAERTAGGGAR